MSVANIPFDQLKYFESVANQLNQATHGKQGEIINRACEFLGLSKSAMYERLSLVGWQSKRKRRTDKGASKLSFEEVEAVSNIVRQSQRQTGKTLMSIEDGIDIAHANNLLANKCSVSTMTRKMKEFGLHPEQLNAAPATTQMRSLHPNEVWEFDVSVCVLYYLKNNEGLRVMEESEFYKNKPANFERIKNDRVLRYLVTDHYSGAFHLSYILSPGESVEAITQFLIEAFSKRSAAELLHGIPFKLIWDAGSANMAAMTKRLLNKLGVEHYAHTPGRPWAKGQVESMHNVIEKKFESRLAFQAINSIEELNEMATRWSVGFQSQAIHSRHKQTRYGMYQTIRSEQLRLAPDIDVMKSFVQTDRDVRTVKPNDLSITYVPSKDYGSLTYSLSRLDVTPGEKVWVSVNLYRCPAIDVEVMDEYGELHSHIVEPMEKDDAGFNIEAPVFGEGFKSLPESTPQRNRKTMDTAAWGANDPKEIKRLRKSGSSRVAFNGDIDPMADVKQQTPPSFIQRRGTPLNVEAIRPTEPPITELAAWKMIADALGIKGIALNPFKQRLKLLYPDGNHSRNQVEDFIKSLGDADAKAQATAV